MGAERLHCVPHLLTSTGCLLLPEPAHLHTAAAIPGELEEVYGSVAFLYLNAALVAITMALCVLLYHVLITRCDKLHLVHQQAVG
jgi:hypothetical protein